MAQQGALVHATWHAHNTLEHAAHVHEAQRGDAHEGRDGYDHETPAGQASLCAFDLAFGQVLGGVHGTSAPLPAVVPTALVVAAALYTRSSVEPVPALARGPPVVL